MVKFISRNGDYTYRSTTSGITYCFVGHSPKKVTHAGDIANFRRTKSLIEVDPIVEVPKVVESPKKVEKPVEKPKKVEEKKPKGKVYKYD